MRRLVPWMLPAVIVAALACGGGDNDSPSATTATPPFITATPPAAPVATATQQPPAETATPAPEAPTQTPAPPPDTSAATEAALDGLARWLGPVGHRPSMTVETVEPVTWPDGCLGAAPPGVACTDALVEGFRVEIGLANATYEVRTDAAGDVTVWVPAVLILVKFSEASPNIVEFSTDDGGSIVAQAVFGTQFLIEPSALSPGDGVGIGLVQAPQSGGFLLVWMAAP